MTHVLVALFAAGGLLSSIVTILSQWSAFRLLGRARPKGGPTPPISILKPLKGLDDGLRDNLASFACQDYPNLEILFGAEDPADPALAVARAVATDYPAIRTSVIVSDRQIGLNPKVNLLAALAAKAHHDYVLVSDSNVRVGPGYVRSMAAELADTRVGLVTSVVAGTGERTIGAAFDNLQLTSFIVRSSLAARFFLGHACVIGKSMLFRLRDLQALGGFASVRDVLAEDYIIGQAFQQAGFEVALSSEPVRTVNEASSVARFAHRHLRWTQMRRRLSLGAYLVELAFNPTLFCLALAALAWTTDQGVTATALAASGVGLKVALDATLARRVRGANLPPLVLALVPLKDLVMTALWLVAGFRRSIEWRGNLFRIEAGTRIVPLQSPAPESAREDAEAHRLVA